MRLFISIRKHFAVIGISSFHAHQKHLLNAKNLTATIILCLTFIVKGMYLVLMAKEFEELTAGFYVVSALVAITLCFEIFIWKMPSVFQLIESLEIAINGSKLVKKLNGSNGWATQPEHQKET